MGEHRESPPSNDPIIGSAAFSVAGSSSILGSSSLAPVVSPIMSHDGPSRAQPAPSPLTGQQAQSTMQTQPATGSADPMASLRNLEALRKRSTSSYEGRPACDHCRRRKIRCDRVQPTCGTCSKLGRVCSTNDVLMRRGPPSNKEKAAYQAAGLEIPSLKYRHRTRRAQGLPEKRAKGSHKSNGSDEGQNSSGQPFPPEPNTSLQKPYQPHSAPLPGELSWRTTDSHNQDHTHNGGYSDRIPQQQWSPLLTQDARNRSYTFDQTVVDSTPAWMQGLRSTSASNLTGGTGNAGRPTDGELGRSIIAHPALNASYNPSEASPKPFSRLVSSTEPTYTPPTRPSPGGTPVARGPFPSIAQAAGSLWQTQLSSIGQAPETSGALLGPLGPPLIPSNAPSAGTNSAPASFQHFPPQIPYGSPLASLPNSAGLVTPTEYRSASHQQPGAPIETYANVTYRDTVSGLFNQHARAESTSGVSVDEAINPYSPLQSRPSTSSAAVSQWGHSEQPSQAPPNVQNTTFYP